MSNWTDYRKQAQELTKGCRELVGDVVVKHVSGILKEMHKLVKEQNALRQQLAESQARVAELSNLAERLQHCAQGFYVDQGDYGHMEAIMKDYHWIMRASKPWRDAFIRRVQAEAVGAMAEKVKEAIGNATPESIYEGLCSYAEQYRQQADQLERGEGDE